eukprot:scaffold625_cov420-Prasinococcus_capsulatus_cf.AAC.68
MNDLRSSAKRWCAVGTYRRYLSRQPKEDHVLWASKILCYLAYVKLATQLGHSYGSIHYLHSIYGTFQASLPRARYTCRWAGNLAPTLVNDRLLLVGPQTKTCSVPPEEGVSPISEDKYDSTLNALGIVDLVIG